VICFPVLTCIYTEPVEGARLVQLADCPRCLSPLSVFNFFTFRADVHFLLTVLGARVSACFALRSRRFHLRHPDPSRVIGLGFGIKIL
jgi:hypothetical protein